MEEDKYYVVLYEDRFKGFLIAKSAEDARTEINIPGEKYSVSGRYITKRSNIGKD